MAPIASTETTRRQRAISRTVPVKVEITNEEILADLLYPAGRDQDRGSRRRPA